VIDSGRVAEEGMGLGPRRDAERDRTEVWSREVTFAKDRAEGEGEEPSVAVWSGWGERERLSGAGVEGVWSTGTGTTGASSSGAATGTGAEDAVGEKSTPGGGVLKLLAAIDEVLISVLGVV
jgi:hypothetical protein